MFESKYSKLLTVLLIIGIIVIVGVLLYLGISMIYNNNIKEEAEEVAEQFQNKVNHLVENEEENSVNTNIVAPELNMENITPGGDSSNQDNKTYYKGFVVVGTIEIPDINLKLPVLESATDKSMNTSVGIYDGVGLNQVGITTIVGHNYRDGKFFANNKQLEEGDKIYITDESGKKVTYSIYKTYITEPEDSSHLDIDTNGKRQVALVTCTDDTQSRLVILAEEQ